MVSRRKKARVEAIAKSKDIDGFLAEFQSESERATAILGAAYLDEQLLQLLTAYFVDDDASQELLSTEKPLGAFGARILTAYCVGLLAREDYQDLNIIKSIRNDFAHHLHGLSFSKESISQKCAKLQIVKRFHPDIEHSSKEIFILAIVFIQMQLGMKIATIKRCQIPSAIEVTQRFSV